MQGERLGGHGLDRRAELVLALVRQHQVLEVELQIGWEVRDRGAALAQQVAADDHVADQAGPRSV